MASDVAGSLLDSGIHSTRRNRWWKGMLSWELDKEQSTGIAQEPGWKAAQTRSNDPDGDFILVY